MFNSLFRATNKPVFDPALGDRLGKIILDEAKRGKLNTLFKEVDLLRNGEWDRRAFYIDLAGKYLTNVKNLETLSDMPLSNLIKGNVAIHLAWRARGGGDANTVSKDGWNLFFRNLDIAGRYISRAGEQDLEDPTPFAFLQTVAQGLQLDRKIADAWFYEANRRDPTNQQAHYRHLFLLCKKWGGSHEDMYAFARETVNKIPTSSTLYSILFLAFQEHYLYLRVFDNNAEGAKAFLRDENIHNESIEMYRDSLQKRKGIESVSDYWPHNVAAWWFLALNMPHIVRQETKKIGPYFTEFPWSIFYKDPGSGYQQALKI